MKALVTGAAGFIGAHVVRELQSINIEVVAIDDLSGGFEDNLPKDITFIQADIFDHKRMSALFEEHQFDYVYHLAAYAAEGLSHFIKRFNYNNNLIGSVNLINESVKHKVKCFVFTSSIAVYGGLKPPMREDMVPQPEDPYGIAKLAVEMELKVTHEMFGLDYVIFRPHNVYGEYQNLGDKYRNVVGIFINQLMQGKPLTIFGDGKQSRAFSYVGDIAPVIAKSVNLPGARNEIFNIGADTEVNVNDLAKGVQKVMNIEQPIRHVAARNEVKHAWSDHSKLKSVFGEQKETTLEYGLNKMIKWASESGIRKGVKFKDIEILEKLPPVWLEE